MGHLILTIRVEVYLRVGVLATVRLGRFAIPLVLLQVMALVLLQIIGLALVEDLTGRDTVLGRVAWVMVVVVIVVAVCVVMLVSHCCESKKGLGI